jgi:hypothetical protein
VVSNVSPTEGFASVSILYKNLIQYEGEKEKTARSPRKTA